MKISIHTRAIQKSGIGNYTNILLKLLPHNGREVEILPFKDDMQVDGKHFWSKMATKFKRLNYNMLYLPRWLKKNNVDVYHNPSNTRVPLWSPCKVVSTIHDIIPHIYSGVYLRSFLPRIYYEMMIRLTIFHSDIIITISEFSKYELMRAYGVSSNKIRVIPQACSSAFRVLPECDVQIIQQKYKLSRPYIMTMGGSEYRKNVKTVLDAYIKKYMDEYDLVVIGGAWRGVDLHEIYRNYSGIHFFQEVSDEDLIGLYNGASVFVFASFYEGFGLPLLEAMNCGIPVISARASCLPEVAGDAAEYFEPLDVESLCNLLDKVLSDKCLQNNMINKGFIRSKLFNWEKTVAMTYEVYQEATRSLDNT